VLVVYMVAYVLWFRHLVWFGRVLRPAPVAAEPARLEPRRAEAA
jgi:hypothetical protein